MKQYVLADSQGVSSSRHRLTPGKFVRNPKLAAAVSQLMRDCCGETPLLAALVSPFPTAEGRMFQITNWSAETGKNPDAGYTVIKEVTPVPQVRVDQRLHFAIAALRVVCRDRDFQKWSQRWLSGEDRSAASAQTCHKIMQQETHANDELAELAAWGAVHESTNSSGGKNEIAERAVHATQAAMHAANGADDLTISRETMLAVCGLANADIIASLSVLAEQVVANPSSGKTQVA